jgi:hypothetical protein
MSSVFDTLFGRVIPKAKEMRRKEEGGEGAGRSRSMGGDGGGKRGQRRAGSAAKGKRE